MRTLVIHNPKSGFGSDAIFQFMRALVHPGDECVLRMLADDFASEEVCAHIDGFDTIVVSGGDGTVSTLLHAMRGRTTPVCVFPSGTANLLCANIGNALEPAALARACRIGKTAQIDLGELSWSGENGEELVRGFAIMSGTGFDAQIMQAALPNKAVMGQAAYFAAALANPKPKVEHFTITVDGKVYERDGITCLVANNAMIQGEIELVPGCRMDDGVLDVIVAETEGAVQLLKPLAFGLVDPTGKAIGRPHLESFSGRQITVESSGPVPLEIDGEVVADAVTSYSARVLPGAVRVVVDALSPYCPADDAPPRFGDSGVIAYPK